MKIRQTLFRDIGFALFQWEGRMTLGDLTKGYEVFSTTPDMPSLTRSLHVLDSVTDLALFQSGLQSLVEMIGADFDALGRQRRSAYVVSDPQVRHVMITYVTLMNRTAKVEARLFENTHEALSWLGVDPEVVADNLPDL